MIKEGKNERRTKEEENRELTEQAQGPEFKMLHYNFRLLSFYAFVHYLIFFSKIDMVILLKKMKRGNCATIKQLF